MRVILSSLLLLCANWALAANVATVAPITYSMTSALLADTDIEVTYLPPTRLPINRIPSWLNRNETEPMAHFDAIVNISSLRPELAFYVPLRSTNVRIVPIDIAKALIPGGEQVATHEPDEYFWLNTNNALLMLGILKRDLIALWPDQADQINANFQANSRALRQVALDMDDALLMSGFDAVTNGKDSVTPFSKGLLLPTLEADELDGMTAVEINTKAGANTWQIDDFSRYSKQSFSERWQATLNNLPTR
ncbi:hypothetical protein [Marinomonas ostreistagni]|uniref:hypothetical protein n=1 Tax=Marinomonas ostreistagni TaxID=359209 RepID=UPI0019529A63|nr:hypothetical protein [Marinomonas ostreistagni]MBM6550959.1 hypothetical protein [Marinomonas ostreistagni]